MSSEPKTAGDAGSRLSARARSVLETLSNAKVKGAADREEPKAPEVQPAAEPAETAQITGLPVARPVRDPAVKAQAATANRVVPLPRRNQPQRAPNDRDVSIALPHLRQPAPKARKGFVGISAWFAIGLPTVLAAIYFLFIAAPQYVAEAKFAIRGPEDVTQGGGDMMGALTGLATPSMPFTGDSFIVAQFISSAQLVGGLQKSIDLRTIYTNKNADFLAAYRPYSGDDTIEHLTTYWNSVSWVYFEPISGVISFTVRAFTPEDALKVARETIRESEKLVNKLSERSREDSISIARQEQSRSELRLKFARKAIQDYRDREGTTDPTALAQGQTTIVNDLEGKLAQQEAQLSASQSFLNKDAPTVRYQRNAIDALKARIAAERAKIGSTDVKGGNKSELISSSIAEFETLQTEREFAEKQYVSASQAAENARVRAERQSRYLTTFVEPHLPEDSTYPARLQMILLVLVCSALSWAIGVLIFYGIRDHSA